MQPLQMYWSTSTMLKTFTCIALFMKTSEELQCRN